MLTSFPNVSVQGKADKAIAIIHPATFVFVKYGTRSDAE
jgi:hypothetical protein